MNDQNTGKLTALKTSIITLAPEFKKALPSHISVDKFQRTVITALTMTPGLVNADERSLFASCMKAASDGLLPDGREAALVTFRDKNGVNQVQYMPMVQGILKKIKNTGELLSLSAHVVYEHDQFDYFISEQGENLTHRPVFSNDNTLPVLCYCVMRTKAQGVYIEVMSVAEIEKVRKSSRAKDSGPWTQWWEEMAKKTVIRRLAKKFPMSSDIDSTLRSDDEFFSGEDIETQTVGKTETPVLKAEKPKTRVQKFIDSQEEKPRLAEDETPL